MHYIIMAGGRSTRFGSEKLISDLCGKKVIDYAIETMKKITEEFYVSTSKNAPLTREYIREIGLNLIETPGNGYPQDIKFMQEYFSDDLLLLNGDSVFIRPTHIRYFLSLFKGTSQTAITYFEGRKVYVGLNIAVINSLEDLEILMDFEDIHLNINTKDDLMEANRICRKLFGL